MAGFDVKVEGVGELIRDFRRADININRELGARNKRIGEKVIARARPLAPVGPPVRGHMRDTMRAQALARGVSVKMGGAKRSPYAPIIHWGSSSYRPNNAPRPFISDAAGQMIGQIEREYLDAVTDALRTVDAG